MNHAAEPWTVDNNGALRYGEPTGASRIQWPVPIYAPFIEEVLRDHPDAIVNGRRIAACVNACERLDHPEGIPELVAAAACYVAMMDARSRTNVPDSILDAARTKIHEALERIHG